MKIERNFEAGETVSDLTLHEKGLVTHTRQPVKILGSGELTKKLVFENVTLSASAKAKIEKSGSTVTGA